MDPLSNMIVWLPFFRRLSVVIVLFSGASNCVLFAADEHVRHSFARQSLTNTYFSEGISCGDINGDGHQDVVYGPIWFEGPSFESKHEIYEPTPQPMDKYADHFFSWVYDFDSDGANDVFTVGFPGTPAYVYINPGRQRLNERWEKIQVIDWVSNESPQWTNLVGDERPELICTRDSFFGFATVDWTKPLSTWQFHPISEKIAPDKFGHGLGVGDINGDGRLDILRAGGWFEQPAKDPETQRWREHKSKLTNAGGGAEMYAYDVDGDGDNDVITSLAAHDFGLAWYEQVPNGDEPRFVEHLIMGKHPSENRYGVLFSELHSVNLADIDGDGLKDIVTGKTYYSHHQKSPMWDSGAVVYWFKLVRGPQGVDWIPYQADDKAGIGRQVVVHDINRDGQLDIATGGMLGAHLLIHQTQAVDKTQWQAAQPKVYDGPKASTVVAVPTPSKNPTANAGGPIQVVGAMEGETLTVKVTGGTAKTQAMGGFTADHWSDNKHLWWTGAKPGNTLSLELDMPAQMESIELVLTGAKNYGIVQLKLDGKPLSKPIDLYRKNVVTTGVLTFPTPDLAPGKHTLEFEIVGSNPQAQPAHMVGIDFLRFRTKIVRLPSAKAPPVVPLSTDEYPHAGLTAEAAAAAMKVPEGFRVQVCAAEPDVKQPIAMALDDRGRTWIAEAYEYPVRATGDQGRDRILIFEDTNGDGKFDSRKIFAEGLNLVSGLEVGFGGVWVGAAPYLLFIPDKNGDDVPDAAPQVLLDGWGFQDTHETLNAFIWGPDGWLYGCHGVFTHSRVGKPGTPDNQRIPINAGVWRYHPTKHVFEVFAHGTSNPWGIDFNENGDAFITACVIPHLFHMIPGARYHRQAGQHFNPYTFNDIKTIADHLHYLGATPHSGNGKSDAAGGGHAHAGAMIYRGGKWPDKYRGALFMNNIHGQRLNVDLLEPKDSGYVGKYAPDFLLTGDVASQILNMRYGPDGQVTMIDWYDMQACHSKEVGKHDRSNGRIYKISYGKYEPVKVNLAEGSDVELAEHCLADNEWYFRHARRLLQERAAKRSIDPVALERLVTIVSTHKDATVRLRALWTQFCIGALSPDLQTRLAADESPYVRSWILKLAFEQSPDKAGLRSLWNRLAIDPSPIVRLVMASILQKIPIDERWSYLEKIALRTEDANDHNLPLMWWYAVEPLAEMEPDRALAWAISAGEKIPLIRDFMLRRVAGEGSKEAIERLVNAMSHTQSLELQSTFVKSIQVALAGQRMAPKPTTWDSVSTKIMAGTDSNLKQQAAMLGVVFGVRHAMQVVREIFEDASQPIDVRLRAIESLVAAKDSDIQNPLLQMVAKGSSNAGTDQIGSLREAAIRGLATYDSPEVASTLLKVYRELTDSQRRAAMATLCGRARNAIELLQAIADKQIPVSDLSADLARQIEYLGDHHAKQMLEKVWGQVRASPAEKIKLIDQYKQLASNTSLPKADEHFGRTMFAKTCQRCHVLFGLGQHLGPDLTGSNRSNIDYLLENVVDPSAVMANEYRQSIVLTDSGQVISGIIRKETEKALTIQTVDALVVVPKDEIEQRQVSEKSMMPEDQLNQFSPHEIRSLLAYLRGKDQVPMLASIENASQLFNGRDLTNWKGNQDLWSVKDGEIIGKSDGLTRNEFLVSEIIAENFTLSVEILLVGNVGNTGIQFRSQATSNGLVEGYQADAGQGWWGKLYEEHGRKLLWDKSGEQHVKAGDWNRYVIEAHGSRIRTYINGNACVDLDDPAGRRKGIFAFQLHSGGPTEVRLRNVQLTVDTVP